ncbi:MAG: response regulator [Candidatus Accumulibacter sp.]|uniref:response regulator n=1 Tax=Accumulibacter sp. TaxID=2053492 RepID=UPI002589A3E6|nr:response regulator [Accumulibacter sp.]MCM8621069.1 response regulator [Accumulibacter sp.]
MFARRRSIRSRLIIAGILSLAIVAILAAAGARSYYLMQHSSAMAAAAAEGSVRLHLTLRALDEIILTEGTLPAKALARQRIVDFDRSLPDLISATDDPDLKAQIEHSFAPRWHAFSRAAEAFSRIRVIGVENEEAMATFGKLIHDADELTRDMETWRVNVGEAIAAELHHLTEAATVAAVLMVLALLALFVWTYRGIMRPISDLLAITARVSQEGDYATRARVDPGDEIGELANGFNTMLDRIEDRNHHLAVQAAELRDARDLAEAGSRAKSEFLAAMSHEVRTPMNGILGMTELLRSTPLSVQQRRFADTVYQSGEHLLNIINDILDFSKIEAGKLEIECINFNLRQLAEDVAYMFAQPATVKGLEMVCSVPHDLPVAVIGDPMRVRQILTNLISNAVKFTSEGEIVITVKLLDETAEQARFRFQVQDSGIGISAEAQARLFGAFVQADSSTTRRFGGSGLGLAISKGLVEAMQGEIGLHSESGRGTLFWFELPLGKQNPDARLTADLAGRLAGLRVLVVDDHATNRELLAHQISGWSMHYTGAASGGEALQALAAAAAIDQPFDLAILDLQMPAMDGFELARTIKSNPRHAALPLVMLSSVSVGGDDPDRQATPVDYYLSKPARQSDLFDAIATAISQQTLAVLATATPSPLPVPTSALTGRVLVAEDNAVNQEVVAAMLASIGVNHTLVSNGRAAIAQLTQEHFDLVLMDCQMPEMDGFDATAAIRSRQREGTLDRYLPVVALTANAVEGDRERCLAAGMDDYLSKPFTREQLASVLGRWLAQTDPAPAGSADGPAILPTTPDAPPAADTDQPINPRALDAIRQLPGPNGAVLVQKVIDAYLTDTPPRIAQLRAAVDAGDAEALRKSAHALKSSGANVGAERLSALFRELEALGRNATVDGAETLLTDLDEELPRVLAALGDHRCSAKAERAGLET